MEQENQQNSVKKCVNCGSTAVSNFCAECGQEIFEKRYSIGKLFLEWVNAFYNYSGGIHYTIKQLTIHPGTVIIDFISGKTRPYWNPFNYFVITFTLYMILGIKLSVITSETSYENFTNDYGAYIVIITVPVVSFISYLLFKRSGYNYAENLILNLFVAAQQNIYNIILFVLYIFLNNKTAGIITIILSILYEFWVYRSFFKNSIVITAIKVIFINIVKILVYIIVLVIIYFIAK